MRLAVIGAPGSGKTTLATILSFLLPPSWQIVYGDAFITSTETNKTELLIALNSTESWVFEHLAAFKVLLDAKLSPDCVVA